MAKNKKVPADVKPQETKVEVVNASENILKTTGSALDANHRVELLNLANDVFRKDPDAERKYSLEVRESMNTIIAAGVVAALADEAIYGNTTFGITLSNKLYPQLIAAANDMGIKLPNIKALPQKEGNVQINANAISISKETRETLKKEKEIEEEKPELNPEKINSEDELIKALSYILITGPKTGKSIKDTLVNAVDFMRIYRMKFADKAENSAEAKLKYDNRTMEDWLNDIFSFVKPTFLMHGIGRGLVSTIGLEKSPITAFCIFRNALTNKETNAVEWDDQSIADAIKSIVKFICKETIANENKGIENLDKKTPDYDNIVKKYQSSIDHYNNIVKDMINTDVSIIENLPKEYESKNETFVKIFGRIKNIFYPQETGTMYKNIVSNIQQYAGYIINLFRDEGTKIMDYGIENVHTLEQYTEEELKEMRKAEVEKKKEEKTEKQETKKEETKPAAAPAPKQENKKEEKNNKKQEGKKTLAQKKGKKQSAIIQSVSANYLKISKEYIIA